MTKSKKIILWAALSSVGIHLLTFLMYFIPYYVVEIGDFASGFEIYEYIRIFLSNFIDFAVPAVASAVLCFCDISQSTGKTILHGLYISLGKLAYLLPYYYLYFMQISGGNDSAEALAMSALAGVFDTLVLWGNILLFCLITRLVAKHFCYRKKLSEIPTLIREKLTEKNKKEIMESAKAEALSISELNKTFDFSNPATVGIFVPAFIQFVLYLIPEITTTADYLKTYAGYYRTNEIIYMIVSFLFILASMLVTHLIAFKTISAFKDKETAVE